MTEELLVLIRYRFGRARECLAEAQLLFDSGHIHACVNRLYYSAFYAASAALLSWGLSSSKHAGLRALFHKNLVKPGLVGKDIGKLFDTLFDSRLKGDYLDLVQFKQPDVEFWLSATAELVDQLERAVRP